MAESVHRRFVLVVSAGSLAFALVVGVLAFVYQYRAEHARAQASQDALVAALSGSATVAAFAGNATIANEVTRGLLASPAIASVRIVSRQGFSHGQVKRAPEAVAAAGDVSRYPLHSPIDQREVIGELRVQRDAAAIDARAVRAASSYAALLVLQIPVFAVLSLFAFHRLIGRPLAWLAAALGRVRPGSRARLAMPLRQAGNEIGRLVEGCNSLLGAAEKAIHEERRLHAEVHALHAHYQRMFESSCVGIMILAADGSLINSNRILIERLLAGVPVSGSCLDALFEEPAQAWSMVGEARDTNRAVSGDLRLRRPDGSEIWAHCVLSVTTLADDGAPIIEGILYDVTARRADESEARRIAEQDALTGLANRRGMEIFLDRALRHAGEAGVQVVVMLLDLDGFKAVNDSRGHAAGDQVLRAVAARMLARIRRSSDLVARLGGDEFVVVLYDFGSRAGDIGGIATDLLASLRAPVRLDECADASVGASIGIACFPVHGRQRDALLQAADGALYEVKRAGKNAYRLASP